MTHCGSNPAKADGRARILSKAFTDMDDFRLFFAYRRNEIVQLSPGPLQAEFLSVQLGKLYFVYHGANKGVQAMGDPVKGFVSFSLVWSEKSSQYYTFRHSINAETTL
ncbi:MAG: hypothetical protein F6K30_08980, partial [Cyanothece sp. SIO2G6]|nr:hypothetical protein [Cyanothece sp. SIO2G6]